MHDSHEKPVIANPCIITNQFETGAQPEHTYTIRPRSLAQPGSALVRWHSERRPSCDLHELIKMASESNITGKVRTERITKCTRVQPIRKTAEVGNYE